MSREKSACEKINVILCCLKNIFLLLFLGKQECAPEFAEFRTLRDLNRIFPPDFVKKEETTKVTINP